MLILVFKFILFSWFHSFDQTCAGHMLGMPYLWAQFMNYLLI